MKKIVAITTLALFLAGSFLVADSCADMHGKGMMKSGSMQKKCMMKKMHKKKGLKGKFYNKAWFIMKHKDELALTDKQVDEVKALKYDTKKAVIMMDAQIDVIAVDIKMGLWEDSIDAQAVNMLVEKKYELKKEKAKMLVNAMAKLKSILTKNQMEKMKELYKKYM